MSEIRFLELELAGSPFEIGLQHGRAVAESLRWELRRLAVPEGLDERLERSWRFVREQSSSLADELAGLAEGAGADLWQVLRYNGLACEREAYFNALLRDHPLIRYAATHESLVISPHVGGVTYESQEMAFTHTAMKLADFLRQLA